VLLGAAWKPKLLLCEPILLIKGSLDLLLGGDSSEAIRRLGRERKKHFWLYERKHCTRKIAIPEDSKTARFNGSHH
jgi:hypothetical protein